MSEDYIDVEVQIIEAWVKLREANKWNIAAMAQELKLLGHHLKARYKGQQSKSQCSADNKLLTDAKELTLCFYFKRLDSDTDHYITL